MPEPQESGKKFVFDWQKIGHVQAVSRDVLDGMGMPPGVTGVSAEASDSYGFGLDHLFLKLKAYVLTHQLAEHAVSRQRTVSWPASPWQHFKQRHAESWWLRWLVTRRPVRMQHEVVDFQEAWTELAAYPWQEHLPPFPQLGKPNRVVLSDVRWTPPESEVDPNV